MIAPQRSTRSGLGSTAPVERLQQRRPRVGSAPAFLARRASRPPCHESRNARPAGRSRLGSRPRFKAWHASRRFRARRVRRAIRPEYRAVTDAGLPVCALLGTCCRSKPEAVAAGRLLIPARTGNARLGPAGAAQPFADSESPGSTERLAGGQVGQGLRPRAHHQDARFWREMEVAGRRAPSISCAGRRPGLGGWDVRRVSLGSRRDARLFSARAGGFLAAVDCEPIA